MKRPEIVSRERWLEHRRELLAAEKAFDKQRDALSAKKRALPWVRLDEPYAFETHEGEKTLAGLFGERSQLLVYHFMLGPDWDEGCPSCSFWADSFCGISAHLAARDASFVVVSRAPLDRIDAYKERMGWGFEWVSSEPCSFNVDFHVSFPDEDNRKNASYNFITKDSVGEEMPGASAFYKDEDGAVFHTYSTYARGLDILNSAYHWLDMAPKGRDEDELEWPMAWLRRHDRY